MQAASVIQRRHGSSAMMHAVSHRAFFDGQNTGVANAVRLYAHSSPSWISLPPSPASSGSLLPCPPAWILPTPRDETVIMLLLWPIPCHIPTTIFLTLHIALALGGSYGISASDRVLSGRVPAPTLKISVDGTCGNTVTCEGSQYGDCCSAHFYCGKTEAYCGKACNSSFGLCDGSPASPPGPPSTVDSGAVDHAAPSSSLLETVWTTMTFSTTSLSVLRLTLWTTTTYTATFIVTDYTVVETNAYTTVATNYATVTATATATTTATATATVTTTETAFFKTTTAATGPPDATNAETVTTTATVTSFAVATNFATIVTTSTLVVPGVGAALGTATDLANGGILAVTKTIFTTATVLPSPASPTTPSSAVPATIWFTATTTSTFVTTLIALSTLIEISTKARTVLFYAHCFLQRYKTDYSPRH